jgi:hypothetical protein
LGKEGADLRCFSVFGEDGAGFVDLGEGVSFVLEDAGEGKRGFGELLDGLKADVHVAWCEVHSVGECAEGGEGDVGTDEGADFFAGDPVGGKLGVFRADLFEEGAYVVGFANAFEEGREDFALDEAGGTDLDGGQEFEELLGGAGLEFE